MKDCLCVVLAVLVFVAGCGGSAPNPVERYMPGDERKSCQALFSEMGIIDNEIAAKQAKMRDRDTWNVLEFIGGILIIIPFFFMDVKGAQEVEIEALRARKKLLMSHFAENGCNAANLTSVASE